MEYTYIYIYFFLGNSINDPATDIDSPLVIVDDTIIRVTNQSNVTGITFSTERLATTAFDQRNVMEDLFASMQCGVVSIRLYPATFCFHYCFHWKTGKRS